MVQADLILPTQSTALPVVRKIHVSQLRGVLQAGWDDFWAMPTHVVFLAALYPVVGVLLYATVFAYDLPALLYPLATGFALVGPFAAIGLYELSRRRELGLDTSWRHAFDVMHSPSLGPILATGALLVFIFAVWIGAAQWIYQSTFGRTSLEILPFIQQVFSTNEGQRLFLVGNAVGFVFALAAASLSVISLPLLLDRNIGFGSAILTSLRVVAMNPVTMLAWFAIVACGLALGTVPFFMGLAVVLPVLGHATWHLYRIAIEPDPSPRPQYQPQPKRVRYAAEFPASLFTRSRDVRKD